MQSDEAIKKLPSAPSLPHLRPGRVELIHHLGGATSEASREMVWDDGLVEFKIVGTPFFPSSVVAPLLTLEALDFNTLWASLKRPWLARRSACSDVSLA